MARLHSFQVFKYTDDGTYTVLRNDTEDDSKGMKFVAQFQARSFLDAHLAHFGKLPPIDRNIRPLVLLLNEYGYVTEYSCSGHRQSPSGYIMLYSDSTENARRLMRAFGAIADALNQTHEDGWPPIVVSIEVVCHSWYSLAHDDEWRLRLDFKSSRLRAIRAAEYAELCERLRHLLTNPAQRRIA